MGCGGKGGTGEFMNDTYIEQKLTERFLSLNDFMTDNGFAGDPYIETDAKGKPLNVSLPNIAFKVPDNNRFFVLSFLPGEPEPAGMGENAENRWTGIFQIDIIVPLDAGTDETSAKYDWICKLFQRGKSFNDITIIRTYRATNETEETFYKTIIRVEFSATLPK